MSDPRDRSTEERIVAATLELMIELGLSGITMTAVAESAGVARQTLYNHFPDVETIITAAVQAHQRESIRALEGILATIPDASARLEHLVRHLAAAAVHHAPMPAIHDSLSAPARETLVVHDRQLRSIIATTLRDGIITGAFRRDLDIARDTIVVHRMLQAVGELVGKEPGAVDEVVTTAARTVLAAVAR